MNVYEEVHRLENYSMLSTGLGRVDCAWLLLYGFLCKQRDGIAFTLLKMKVGLKTTASFSLQ